MNHAVVETMEQAQTGPVSFSGRRGQLAVLLVRNLLLTMATLGIYRFWAKTRVRGFLWRHVQLLGEPLEYLGTGTGLLIGFLIALVIVAPFTSAYSLLPLLIPDGVPYSGLVLQALYYLVLWFLFQVAVHRVRRYRLTRTAWQGVRFGLGGSSLEYALIWSLYGFVTLATLGMAYPWLRVATTRYFASHARFGSTDFSFDGHTRRLPGSHAAFAGAWGLRRWSSRDASTCRTRRSATGNRASAAPPAPPEPCSGFWTRRRRPRCGCSAERRPDPVLTVKLRDPISPILSPRNQALYLARDVDFVREPVT